MASGIVTQPLSIAQKRTPAPTLTVLNRHDATPFLDLYSTHSIKYGGNSSEVIL
ncbi:hypothetical protein KCP74_16760 [Salmonella enterica subsp. enterica]|nr:hypothetical protein KCP74_16760 [Salmonella enterica subsp. enterica]